jgi:serine/threonine protein kinase
MFEEETTGVSEPIYEKFGNFILLEKIAAGGMAEVFLAKKIGASGVQKFLSVKRILPQFSESEDYIRMFKEEAKIAVHLSHSNVISIHEFGVENNQFYIAMEYCEGRNLRQILNKMKTRGSYFTLSQVVYIAKEVAAGLDHAHRCLDGSTGKPLNIVHRDMSPQNIMVSFEGEVKIVDFGIAKATNQLEHTRAGTLKGKYGYMSPEQTEGQPVDYRTDIFSLGIVLWELLAKERLFLASTEILTLKKIRECKIPSLQEIDPSIPAELESIVMKALSRDKNYRYQSASDLHKDLNRFLNRTDPDFSPQDLSVAIKTLFSQEILSSRQRLIQYSKYIPESNLTVPTITKKSLEEEMETHRSSEFNHTRASDSFDDKEESVSNSDFSKLLRDNDAAKDLPSFANKTNPVQPRPHRQPGHRPPSVGTNSRLEISRTYSGTKTNSKFLDFNPYEKKHNSYGTAKKVAPILALIAFVGYLAYTNPPTLITQNKVLGETCREMQIPFCMTWGLDFGEKNLASAFNQFQVISTPPGAEILINGVRTGQRTPSHVAAPQGPFTLSLQLPGYHTREDQFSSIPSGPFQVQLEKASVGYLQISVVGNGEIYVDGQLVGVNSARIPVPTGKRVKVRAVHNITKAFDEKEVTVQEDRVLPVVLTPALN